MDETTIKYIMQRNTVRYISHLNTVQKINGIIGIIFSENIINDINNIIKINITFVGYILY